MSDILFYKSITNCCNYEKGHFLNAFSDLYTNNKFIDVIGFNRLENNLSQSLNKEDLDKLSKCSGGFNFRAHKIALRSMSCFNGAINISKIFTDHKIDYVFLKAVALYTYDQECISVRPSSDIDIFIKKKMQKKL